jgi:hypothetical protein
METGLESVPEIIKCYGCGRRGSWPNISGANFTGGTVGPYPNKKYFYTFNNLWNKKVTFRLELIGQEFEFLIAFKIDKITTRQ